MKITRVESWRDRLELERPYTIATRTITHVELFFVRIVTDKGPVGVGSASPAEEVTGENAEDCWYALSDAEPLLAGRDPRRLGELTRALRDAMKTTPAARAALDMALHDLFTRHLGIPLVQYFGRCHPDYETSITLGINSLEETLTDAEAFLGRGFHCLKVKIGLDLEEDVERLTKLREKVGPWVRIRVDANQGYHPRELSRFVHQTDRLRLELIEQPLDVIYTDDLRMQPNHVRRILAADESLVSEEDALDLVRPPAACGIFNIKLMKCGGPSSARTLAEIAEAAHCELMWGCMDESIVSITAALHTAYGCQMTQYLDLDGSFDLGRDVATGGFTVEDGRLVLGDGPGLGVELRD